MVSENKKKLLVIMMAISAHILLEEEALFVISKTRKKINKNFNRVNLWGISGRQNIMQMREIIRFGLFKR